MQVPVLVELLGDRPGYLARLGEPFNLTAEAGTPEEALHELSRAVELRLQTGARLMPLTLPSPSTPFGVHGWLPDDELTHEWRQAVEDYRRDCDEADRRRILGEAADEKAAS